MDKKILSKKIKPVKSLIMILKKRSGRDNSGQISVRHQGGRQKRFYRIIDFKRDKRDMEAKVIRIERDPNRNSFIALVRYKDDELRYILYPNNLKIGDKIIASEKADIKNGNALPLKNIPIGTLVHNVELYIGKGGQMIKSAGTAAFVIAKEEKYTQLKLPSGEVRRFFNDCWATVGQLGNIKFKDEIIGSAGRKRLMGIRPTVRGVAQNPRSHPHGGGEARSGIGMSIPKTYAGRPAVGRKRKKNKYSDKYIIQRRKK